MSGVEFEPRLVLRQAPLRAATAWLLPGDEPARWLDALGALAAAQGASASSFELWVAPGAGLLALARRPREAAPLPCLAQPYGLVGERLLVPVDGALFPEVTDAELDRLLAPDLHLLHPAAGLVRLAPEARLEVGDLLAPPPAVAGAWRALEPPTAPLRLASIEVQDPPALEAFLHQGADGVAVAPPSEAPPTPEEQRQTGAGAWLEQQAARFVQWAAGAEPEKDDAPRQRREEAPGQAPQAPAPGGGGLFDRLLRWSEKTLEGVKDARERELDRLLHLLEHDPDEGLRYALPLVGGASGGPPAPPGTRLPRRRVDYGGGAPRRGAAADAWEIDAERHRRLAARYRELANRELRLGRYRRAAYVFAELLGDLAAAASALEQGRHFREAAALYKDRLGRPLDAARCLERGGLLAEAAALYEAEGRWVEAGDAWRRLERADDARRAYRRAVEARLERDDALGAARLLETKLGAPDEALAVLASTWPAHAQAGLCLEERLGLLGRQARHAAARALLDELRQDPRREGRELVLARALGGAVARYPEATVQARARDLVRVVTGERLARRPGPEEAEALLQAIARLDPADRLLARDVGRMSAQLRREAAKAAAARARVRGEGWAVHLARERRVGWSTATGWRAVELDAWGALWAARVTKNGSLRVVRVGPGGETAHGWWAESTGRILLAPPAGRRACAIVVGVRRALALREVPARDGLPRVEVGTPGWVDPGAVALAGNDDGAVWALARDPASEHLALTMHDPRGALLGTCAVALPRDPTTERAARSPLLRASRSGGVVLVLGQDLLRFEGTAPLGRWSLGREARDLATHDARAVAAVSFDEGGRVVFFYDHDAPGGFGQGLVAPRVAITPDGLLVAVTRDEGRVYVVHERRVEHAATFEGSGREVLCVRSTGRARAFVVVTADGAVREYELTRS